MIILVIPDVHLKPWMFERASQLMKETNADQAVCLMNIADDWGMQFKTDLYIQTYDAAIAFAKEYQNTLWCYGNHDLSYLWKRMESGYSWMAEDTVCRKLDELKEAVPDEKQLAYVHRIDDVLFSHGGVSDVFVRRYVPASHYNDIDAVIRTINVFDQHIMWQDQSPIWLRPQYDDIRMYKPRKLLQVVGHTPVKDIIRTKNLISCDVFSTYSNHRPIGTQVFPLVDTVSRDCESCGCMHTAGGPCTAGKAE